MSVSTPTGLSRKAVLQVAEVSEVSALLPMLSVLCEDVEPE